MAHRSAPAIRCALEDTRKNYEVARHSLNSAIKGGTDYIDDLPPFLYTEFVMLWTAFQDLQEECKKAAAHEAVEFRRNKLWLWLQGLPYDTTEHERAVQEVEE